MTLTVAALAAVDVELATKAPDSICEIGVAYTCSIGDTRSAGWLIRPPQNRYWPDFIDIHQIEPAMTEDAPAFDQIWPTVEEILNGRMVVAHHAPFDHGCVTAALARSGASPPRQWACTLRMAHLVWPERDQSYSLSTLADEWGLTLSSPHEAQSDAEATLELADLLAHIWELRTGEGFLGLVEASNDGHEARSRAAMQRIFRARPPEPPTDKQMAYLVSLLERCGLTESEVDGLATTKYRASRAIDVLASAAAEQESPDALVESLFDAAET